MWEFIMESGTRPNTLGSQHTQKGGPSITVSDYERGTTHDIALESDGPDPEEALWMDDGEDRPQDGEFTAAENKLIQALTKLEQMGPFEEWECDPRVRDAVAGARKMVNETLKWRPGMPRVPAAHREPRTFANTLLNKEYKFEPSSMRALKAAIERFISDPSEVPNPLEKFRILDKNPRKRKRQMTSLDPNFLSPNVRNVRPKRDRSNSDKDATTSANLISHNVSATHVGLSTNREDTSVVAQQDATPSFDPFDPEARDRELMRLAYQNVSEDSDDEEMIALLTKQANDPWNSAMALEIALTCSENVLQRVRPVLIAGLFDALAITERDDATREERAAALRLRDIDNACTRVFN